MLPRRHDFVEIDKDIYFGGESDCIQGFQMNILPKKKWHVRTKENMARVRRDEAKAAEEEAKRQERIRIAENEDRIRRLKAESSRGNDEADGMVKFVSAGRPELGEDGKSHVNLFASDERLRNHELTNKEAEKEKKKELDDREHKLGNILE